MPIDISKNKLLRKGLLLLLTLFFIAGCSTQRLGMQYRKAKKLYKQGIEFGVQGKFSPAQKKFTKVPRTPEFDGSIQLYLIVIADVLNNRIKQETAIHLFKTLHYADKQMLEEATNECREAIALEPKYAYTYLILGTIYHYYLGATDTAISEYEKAIAANPDIAEFYNFLGSAYRMKGNFARAITEFKTAIALKPNYAEAYTNIGVCYGARGLTDLAIPAYNKSIKIDPEFAPAYTSLGVIYAMLEQWDKARYESKRSVAIDPLNAESWYSLGSIYFLRKDWKLAADAYQKALIIKPNYTDAQIALQQLRQR